MYKLQANEFVLWIFQIVANLSISGAQTLLTISTYFTSLVFELGFNCCSKNRFLFHLFYSLILIWLAFSRVFRHVSRAINILTHRVCWECKHNVLRCSLYVAATLIWPTD